MPDQTTVDKAVAALYAQTLSLDIELAKEHIRAVLRTYGFDETNSAVVDRGGRITVLLRLDPSSDYSIVVTLGGVQ